MKLNDLKIKMKHLINKLNECLDEEKALQLLVPLEFEEYRYALREIETKGREFEALHRAWMERGEEVARLQAKLAEADRTVNDLRELRERERENG
jgi:DNA repair exonuclease SbcCD ATPase subunit